MNIIKGLAEATTLAALILFLEWIVARVPDSGFSFVSGWWWFGTTVVTTFLHEIKE